MARRATQYFKTRRGLDLAIVRKIRDVFQMTPVDAKFELEKKFVEVAADNNDQVPLVSRLRFVLYPSEDRRAVLCTAERTDGGPDVEVYFELPTPADHDEIDEDAVERLFLAIPSGERH
jgi:hypothetical protein